MNGKALARYFYANVPGVAALRFAAKDLLGFYFFKSEYAGASLLNIGNALIVDVGANRGQSIAAFKRLAPKAKILAFEPLPKLVDRLKSRYRGDSTVTVCGCALGARFEVITLFLPTYGNWECDGMAATDRAMAVEWLNDPGRMLHFDPTKLTVTEYEIESKTLDSFAMAPELIKIHAQGAELDVLRGAEQTIIRHNPVIMCAFPTAAVDEQLSQWGYKAHVYRAGRFALGSSKPPTTFTWFLPNSS